MTQPMLYADHVWVPVRDADPTALDIFTRHYSLYRYKDGRLRRKFIGPGEYMLLMTPDATAIFAWRKFISADGQQGINCSVFRNEGGMQASYLIREADALADARWPGERHYTYVNPRKVRGSRTPGRCFLKAGWRYLKTEDGKRYLTKARKLLVLERLV